MGLPGRKIILELDGGLIKITFEASIIENAKSEDINCSVEEMGQVLDNEKERIKRFLTED